MFEDINLLPCPFCGNKATILQGSSINNFVSCYECKASKKSDISMSGFYETPQMAADAWNTRVEALNVKKQNI